ncbi:hypothetical protein GCM10025876_05570 [Demequina litorisediminis]|uniref:Extracellular endo-alpha-(1->5)-L-arabinanase C-terminal domain-containing protein n=1 Tax=Demequina litorisediminis TaxID=1849022 RepID=A0ABQ6IC90_9MICO|nr:hypothetical protein GCM10025876_05570 [Demequina litorisediminis]
MYYNACKGDSPRSALGIATSDEVDGPYENQGILLKSGMWDQESENPGEIYDATVHPNAVDPDAFYDAEGNMWMVYGSYSGGIFILELDPETGVPLPGQGYGKHLVGGNHSRIEAPTIRYDEETGYYYLFLSFGGLDASGGYDVRVARSTSPDGPYLDAEGNDMSTVKGAEGTIFDDATIQEYGVKVMGGYEFPRLLGDPGEGTGTGYVSAGHTSWYDDPDSGQSFMVFHTRFPGTGEMHEVRVHRMEMNADGWPVVMPTRYGGEGNLRAKLTEMIGDWQLVDLGHDITAEPALPSDVRFTALGRITGDLTGTWRLRGTDKVEPAHRRSDLLGNHLARLGRDHQRMGAVAVRGVRRRCHHVGSRRRRPRTQEGRRRGRRRTHARQHLGGRGRPQPARRGNFGNGHRLGVERRVSGLVRGRRHAPGGRRAGRHRDTHGDGGQRQAQRDRLV